MPMTTEEALKKLAQETAVLVEVEKKYGLNSPHAKFQLQGISNILFNLDQMKLINLEKMDLTF